MNSEKSKKSVNDVKMLNLLDAPRTWFQFDKNVYSVRSAPPEIFDAWICQYVEEITNVDVTKWEIFHRWNIINFCIEGDVLCLKPIGEGHQSVEEKASDSEASSEEKASDFTSELEEYNLPEPA